MTVPVLHDRPVFGRPTINVSLMYRRFFRRMQVVSPNAAPGIERGRLRCFVSRADRFNLPFVSGIDATTAVMAC